MNEEQTPPPDAERSEPDRPAPPTSAVSRGASSTARGISKASRFTYQQARKAASAQGAKESGLSRLIEMHAFNTAGDAAVAIALAGSLFFQVPGSGEDSSRQSVALFLLLTMVPFAFVAPLLGPLLDRVAYGRRWAVGATMATRAFLCWILAGAIANDSAALFPAALGVLVASKAYGVTRAAAVPRLRPPSLTLVKANGRVAMAGIVGVCFAAPIAGLASLVGPEWVLRWAFVLFIGATVLAIRLPAEVDSNAGEASMALTPLPLFSKDDSGAENASSGTAGTKGAKRSKVPMPAPVAYALRANCGPKWLYGFFLMFMAFLLQTHPLDGWSPTLLLAVVAGAAGAGNFIGVTTATLVTKIKPAWTVTAVLVIDAVTAGATLVFYSAPMLILLGLVTGAGASLAKFSLDSTIQTHVPPAVQASAFARSDTTLQFAWVIGGFVGIVLPLNPDVGLTVATACLAGWAIYVMRSRPGKAATVPAT